MLRRTGKPIAIDLCDACGWFELPNGVIPPGDSWAVCPMCREGTRLVMGEYKIDLARLKRGLTKLSVHVAGFTEMDGTYHARSNYSSKPADE